MREESEMSAGLMLILWKQTTTTTKINQNMLMALFLCYFPVLQALLWAPSPRFWFLCSSFALGGLASKGLRLPSLKSDVHSTCWFFKQLCPQKNQDKPLTLSSRRNWGQGRGGGGYGARAIRLYFAVPPFLFLSLPHYYLSISVLSLISFFNFPVICLIEPKHNDLSECLTHFAWHVVEREPAQNNLSLKASVASPKCDIPISQIQGYCSHWFHCYVAT